MDNQVLDTPNPFGFNRPLPNSTAVLVLGIVSIVTCCCYGIVGLICGIIAIVLAQKDLTLYAQNPNMFTVSSKNNLNAGKICAIIGVCISALYLIAAVAYLIAFGSDISKVNWQELLKK